MTQAEAQEELVTLLADTLQQVSAERLENAINEAWRDAYVAEQVYDTTSLVFAAGSYAYAVPTTMTTVDAIYMRADSTQGYTKVDSDLWEVVDGQIIFSQKGTYRIPVGALQVRGHKKLAADDDISADNFTLQNYVVTLAGFNILKYMGYTKVLSFLRNDTSLQELMAFKSQIQQDMLNYRRQLQATYVDN